MDLEATVAAEHFVTKATLVFEEGIVCGILRPIQDRACFLERAGRGMLGQVCHRHIRCFTYQNITKFRLVSLKKSKLGATLPEDFRGFCRQAKQTRHSDNACSENPNTGYMG